MASKAIQEVECEHGREGGGVWHTCSTSLFATSHGPSAEPSLRRAAEATTKLYYWLSGTTTQDITSNGRKLGGCLVQ